MYLARVVVVGPMADNGSLLDVFSRRAIAARMKQGLALLALNTAIALRRPPPGCIHHTDRGSQYCADDYQKLLRKQGSRC